VPSTSMSAYCGCAWRVMDRTSGWLLADTIFSAK
jgi:hypothetical protein